MIQFNLDTSEASAAASPFAVSVIGIGGSGTNVIDKIALEGMPGADLVSLNCDTRALNTSMAGTKVQLGKSLTQGLGCGGDPELGTEAAHASADAIRELLAGRQMVFLCVGLGGGTGSGAAPVVARLAREAGAFVVVFATMPFVFEGRRRSNQASVALQDLRKYANALVTFENDRMGELVVPKKGVQEAFELADKIIGQSVRAVTSLVTQPGLIHIGMDDLVTALRNTDSRCLFGYGQAKGENRAVEALGIALKSPLLDRGQMLTGARNVLVHICGGATLTLFEIETLMRELGKQVHEDAQILFGAATDARLAESLSVTILTSLSKPSPAAETAAIAAVAAPVASVPEPVVLDVPSVVVPVAVAETVSPAVQAVAAAPAPESNVRAKPGQSAGISSGPEALTLSPAMERTAPVFVEETELFPETIQLAEPLLIEIPAVTPAAKTPVRPLAVPPPVEEPPASLAVEETTAPEAEIGEVAAMEARGMETPVPDDLGKTAPAPVLESGRIYISSAPSSAPEPVILPSTASPLDQSNPGEEAKVEGEEEEGEEALAPTAVVSRKPVPPVETAAVPGRVIRIERRPEERTPVAPNPMPAAEETAPATRRFVLSDIIKPKASPAPLVEPVMEYSAPEEVAEAPLRPVPASIPASRRTPDFDQVAPIRPIPAGRATTPPSSSPATPPAGAGMSPSAKPAGRPVPTQQQTFDERLQPATAGGRFDRSKPTVEEGEDLDVPTFLRRKR